MTLSIYYQNVRGLRTKTDELLIGLHESEWDIICLTETWLNDGINTAELITNKQLAHRRDRNYERSKTTRGGGCMIIQSKQIDSFRRFDLESDIEFIEDIWIQLPTSEASIYLCTVYITSKTDNYSIMERFHQHMIHIILNLKSEDRVIILGDFNVREVDWIVNDDNTTRAINTNNEKGTLLMNSLNLSNLSQYNSIPNKDNKMLDLILTNENPININVSQPSHSLVNEDSFHPSLVTRVKKTINYLNESDHRR